MNIEEFEHHGVTITLAYDEEPESPREWSNHGTMLCNYRGYLLGDQEIEPGEHEDLAALIAWLREEYEPTVILPLYILDHSGLAMSAGDPIDLDFRPSQEHFLVDPGGWDTSMVGFILDTPQGIEECGAPEDMEAALRAEVKIYDSYLQGQVYGYSVEDGNSCWGFYDLQDAREEAKDSAEFVARERAEQRATASAAEIATFATYAWNGEEVLA